MADSAYALRGRLGAHVLHSRYDSRQITKRAREAFMSKFEREVIEAAQAQGESLSEVEIQRRAEHLRRAHFTRLALASAKARRRK